MHARQQSDRAQRVRRRPGQEGQAHPRLSDDHGPQLRRGAARDRLAAAHRQAQGGDAGELEAWRGRDHRRLGLGRGGEEAISARLESAQALYPRGAAAGPVRAHHDHDAPALEIANPGQHHGRAAPDVRRPRVPARRPGRPAGGWRLRRRLDGGQAVAGQRYDALGNKTGSEVDISGFDDGDQFAPAIATLPNGNVAVAFVDTSLGSDIYVRIFNSALGSVRTDFIDLTLPWRSTRRSPRSPTAATWSRTRSAAGATPTSSRAS